MRRGFTLIELMVVISIVVIIAAIAIPNLMSSREAANESAARSTLQSLFIAQKTYHLKNGSYTNSFTALNFSGFTGSDYTIRGFRYRLFTNAANTQWWCYATPENWGTTGEQAFFICELNNQIHYTSTNPGTPSDRNTGLSWSVWTD